MVRRLAGLGASVVVADINGPGAERVAAGIVADGGTARPCPVDVAQPDQIRTMVDGALSDFGRVDILHNNAMAGSPLDLDVVNLDLAAWDLAMSVNLRGYLLGCQAVLPTCWSVARASSSTRRRIRPAPGT